MGRMQEIINEASNVTPLVVVNGRNVYSTEDAQRLNTSDLMEEKAVGSVDLGERSVNPDGTYASSRAKNIAIDPQSFFENRYRKVGDGYEVVTDYRAIKEHGTGHIYTDNIIVHKIGKDKGGSFEHKGTKVIGADEFVRGFKNRLGSKTMTGIYAMLQSGQTSDVPVDELDL